MKDRDQPPTETDEQTSTPGPSTRKHPEASASSTGPASPATSWASLSPKRSPSSTERHSSRTTSRPRLTAPETLKAPSRIAEGLVAWTRTASLRGDRQLVEIDDQ